MPNNAARQNATRIHGSDLAARPRTSCAERTRLQVGHRIPQLTGAVRDQPDMRIAAARSNGCWQFGQIRVVAIESPSYRRVRNAAYLWQWTSALVADLIVPVSGPCRRKIDPKQSAASDRFRATKNANMSTNIFDRTLRQNVCLAGCPSFSFGQQRLWPALEANQTQRRQQQALRPQPGVHRLT
jgi:hypothetical protein